MSRPADIDGMFRDPTEFERPTAEQIRAFAEMPRVCEAVGQEAVLVDGKWVCPECGIEIVPLEGREDADPISSLVSFPHTPPKDYEGYLASPAWAQLRDRALEAAGHRCRGCNTNEHLEVHHRTYERVGAEELEDLTVLCAACHTAVHLVADGRRGKVRTEGRRV